MGVDGVDFEVAMKELEKIIAELEKGELSLENSIERFQKGIEISKLCSKRLDDVEKKITIILEDEQGNIKEEPFLMEKPQEV